MEKGDSKIATVETRAETSSKFLGFLAGAVALLAISFIVLIACGTVVLNNKACEEQPTKSTTDVTQRYDIEYRTEENKFSENVVMHPGRQMEYIVTRDADTGLVQSVVTVDFNAKTTTMYSAKLNLCFMVRDETREFDDVVRELHEEEKMKDTTAQRLDMDFDLGEKVKDVNDIPVEMSAFCTTTNTNWLEKKPEHERNRRQADGVCFDCMCSNYIVTINGSPYYVCWCVWCFTCVGCPCTGLTDCYQGYGYYNGNNLILGK